MADDTQPLNAALEYARRGWPVLPLHTMNGDGRCTCGRADCDSPGKHPRTAHGVRDATTDEGRIRAWWARWPDANVAVPTGASGATGAGTFVALDLDRKDDGTDGAEVAKALHAKRRRRPRKTSRKSWLASWLTTLRVRKKARVPRGKWSGPVKELVLPSET